MATCMAGSTFSIAELCLCVSVEIVNKRAKFSFQIVVMSLSDNVNYMLYSTILRKQFKSICPELERTSFYEKLNYLVVCVYGKGESSCL